MKKRSRKPKSADTVKTLIVREGGDLVGWIEVDNKNRIHIVQSVDESEKRIILQAFVDNPTMKPLEVAEKVLRDELGYEIKVA